MSKRNLIGILSLVLLSCCLIGIVLADTGGEGCDNCDGSPVSLWSDAISAQGSAGGGSAAYLDLLSDFNEYYDKCETCAGLHGTDGGYAGYKSAADSAHTSSALAWADGNTLSVAGLIQFMEAESVQHPRPYDCAVPKLQYIGATAKFNAASDEYTTAYGYIFNGIGWVANMEDELSKEFCDCDW